MESKPTKAMVRRVVGAIKHSNKKVITLEALSRLVGVYPDVLGDALSEFEPMILMDPSINCRDMLPDLEAYLAEPSAKVKKEPGEKRVRVYASVLNSYASIGDFIYKKMTSVGGLFDASTRLSDEDLAVLRKLVAKEESKRRKEARLKKKKQ